MAQSLKAIQSAYDSFAAEYADAFSDELDRKPKDRDMLHRFAAEVKTGRHVWDFGCGPGHIAAFLGKQGLRISGMDLSERMVEEAKKRHPDIPFLQGNTLALELKDNSVAGAVAFYAIVHFSEAQVITFLEEIFRVLTPGGIFLMTFHIGEDTIHIGEFLGRTADIDFMFFTTAFIRNCLDRIGFRSVEIIEREPYSEAEFESRRAYAFARKPADAASGC